MNAPKRSKSQTVAAAESAPRSGRAFVDTMAPANLLGCAEVIRLFESAAGRARKRGRPVEAAMLFHIASRLGARVSTWEEFRRVLDEVGELIPWLPMPAKRRQQSLLERKASMISFIRSLKQNGVNENLLIWSATQRPGRPVDTRAVAVRAMELHMRGQHWAKIEKRLLPRRRYVTNSGRSINREVQFLKATLRKYRVRLTAHQPESAQGKQSAFQSK